MDLEGPKSRCVLFFAIHVVIPIPPLTWSFWPGRCSHKALFKGSIQILQASLDVAGLWKGCRGFAHRMSWLRV